MYVHILRYSIHWSFCGCRPKSLTLVSVHYLYISTTPFSVFLQRNHLRVVFFAARNTPVCNVVCHSFSLYCFCHGDIASICVLSVVLRAFLRIQFLFLSIHIRSFIRLALVITSTQPSSQNIAVRRMYACVVVL